MKNPVTTIRELCRKVRSNRSCLFGVLYTDPTTGCHSHRLIDRKTGEVVFPYVSTTPSTIHDHMVQGFMRAANEADPCFTPEEFVAESLVLAHDDNGTAVLGFRMSQTVTASILAIRLNSMESSFVTPLLAFNRPLQLIRVVEDEGLVASNSDPSFQFAQQFWQDLHCHARTNTNVSAPWRVFCFSRNSKHRVVTHASGNRHRPEP